VHGGWHMVCAPHTACQVDAAVACCANWRQNSVSACCTCAVLQKCPVQLLYAIRHIQCARLGGDHVCCACIPSSMLMLQAKASGQLAARLLCTFEKQVCSNRGVGAIAQQMQQKQLHDLWAAAATQARQNHSRNLPRM
jgi:hypothetical protein